MSEKLYKYVLFGVKVLLTLIFFMAGLSKLIGTHMMVQTYDTIGIGQWFRYVTGFIEIFSVILLWIRGYQVWGAFFLLCTMIGAVLAHFFILGPSAIPAFILGVLSVFVLWSYRN